MHRRNGDPVTPKERVLTDMPQFRFRGSSYAELTEDYQCQTPIKGEVAAIPHVLLASDGLLLVSKGFHWDFGSGPALNTPAMIYASLTHDCLYLLMQEGELPWHWRKAADQLFYQHLLHAGMNTVRARWCYWGVRYGYPIWSWWSGDREHDTRRS